ncbi:hypothetical protein AMTRI_Chr02g216010 [Amborella trichopoda]
MVQSAAAAGCQVRCAGCRGILNVAAGMTEFCCPNCQLPQMLPPELRGVAAKGIDPTKIQLPCARCSALLNVPHGLSKFTCPQCGVDLAVDLPKLQNYLLSSSSSSISPFHQPPPPPPPPEEINEVAVDVEREEDEGGMVGDTFTDYRPSKISIGGPHPDAVVETSSLAAVQPPEPSYDLRLKDEIEKSKALSCLQIETIVYACQRHLHHLLNDTRAGFFMGDGAGVGKGRTIAGLIWENWHLGRHKALWISVGSDLKFDARRDLDDVGASCVEVHALNKLPYSKLESKSVGIKQGVIFSTYSSLIASSERGRSRLQQLIQWCGPEFDGLLVFDECHKAKNLIPETGGQATRTGEAVLEIQDRLPQARVVYCSATGASEPRNMGYMVRLGLWGAGTSFPHFQAFLGALEKRGIGALELVAMDMKARGMYVCRTLSFQGAEFEVIEALLEAKMTRFFRHMCMSAKVPAAVRLAKQALAEGKCVVIGLQSTGEARTEEAVTKYGLELDDFVSGPRELLIKLVEENYPLPTKPESFTGEESVRELQRKRHSASPGVSFKGRVRKIAKWKVASDESGSDSPIESDHGSSESDEEFQICDICVMEEEKKKLLRCSCCGKLFHPNCFVPPLLDVVPENWSCVSCKEETDEYVQARQAYLAELHKRYEAAIERKSTILEIVRSMDLPNNPLDDIIDQLGGPDNVAEMTGRRGMLVRASTGKGVVYQTRNTKEIAMEMVNMHEKQLFMDGKKLVAIISEAGSAGVSLQADRRAINQKRRVHLTLELPWSADRAIQQLGRTHRSNQACAPEYRLLITNLGGERRFASIVAKRLETLGALTQGDRRAGPSLSAFNYDSNFGKRALSMLYKAIMEQTELPVVPPGCLREKPEAVREFLTQAKAALVSVGIIRDSVLVNGKDNGRITGRIVDSDMHDVGRFLNRLLGLPPDIQNRLFEFFTSILDLLIQDARKEGQLDSGIVDIKANVIEMQGSPKTVHVDPTSGASTVLLTFTVDRGITWEAASDLLECNKKDGVGYQNDGFYESKREWMGRRHYLLAFECNRSSPRMFKVFRPASGEALREMPFPELQSKYRLLSSLEKACKGWNEEYEASSKQCMHGPKCKVGRLCSVGKRLQEVNILGGLILPLWGTIEEALSKQVRQSHTRLRVVRLETTEDNRRVVGLLIPNAAVHSVLEDLSWDADEDS